MPHDFTLNGCRITGGHIGNKTEALAMLKLAAEKNVHPLIETIAISEKGCRDAVQKVKTRDVRGCVVLTNFKEAFGTDWVAVLNV
jgi:alcohol dehydrogenase (NADP+)